VVETPARVAVMTAVTLAETAPAVAVKLAEEAPAATVTDDGTVSDVVLEVSATVDPPVAVAAFSVTVQVVEPLDVRLLAAHFSEETVAVAAGAVSEIEADCELPSSVAVTLAV